MDVAKEEGLVTQEQREKTKEGARRSSEVDKKEQEAGAAAEQSEKAEREAQTGVCGSMYQGLPQCHFGWLCMARSCRERVPVSIPTWDDTHVSVDSMFAF